MNALPPLARRHAIGLLAGSLLLGRGVVARAGSPLLPSTALAAVPFPEGATILVAGPDGGHLGVWGNAVAMALDATLPPETKVRTTCAGGIDGVTGANQFETRVPADGATLLLAPGAATLGWLVGDPRVHFDAEHWVPVMAGVTPAIVMARPDATSIAAGRPIRLAASGPVGPQLPALLGLDLLGAQLVPVFGLVEQEAITAAYVAGKVDAVLAWGTNVPQQVAALRQAGATALFVLGGFDATGTPNDAPYGTPNGTQNHDPAFPDVPTFVELYVALHGTKPAGARYDAWRATAAATQLEFGLVLPRLTSAAMVALWRRAAGQAVGQPDVQTLTDAFAVRPLEGVAAAAAMTSVAVDSAALLELRGWLATRLNWRPT
jgi:hypothetical protein